MIRQHLRRSLRQIAIHYPGLQRISGRMGVGRLLAPANTKEQIKIDGDITLELDMSVPAFRYLYFHHDLSAEPETQLLRALLKPADVFVDVGAHIGVFALVAAKYAAAVHAFEISPATADRLRRNLALNPSLAGKVTLHAVGLGEQAGEMQLYNSAGQPDLASLRPLARDDAFCETVEVATLDKQLAGTPVSWLKIDVEGGELGVLRGASGHLAATHPWVLVEMFEPFQRRFGASCAQLDGFLGERGYQGFQLLQSRGSPGGPQLATLDLDKLDQVQVNNVLYVPPEQRLPAGMVGG